MSSTSRIVLELIDLRNRMQSFMEIEKKQNFVNDCFGIDRRCKPSDLIIYGNREETKQREGLFWNR